MSSDGPVIKDRIAIKTGPEVVREVMRGGNGHSRMGFQHMVVEPDNAVIMKKFTACMRAALSHNPGRNPGCLLRINCTIGYNSIPMNMSPMPSKSNWVVVVREGTIWVWAS